MYRSFSDDEIRSLTKRISYSCKKYKIKNDEVDDIVQDILLKFYENKDSKQTIDQAVIDYIRKNYGDSRTEAGRKKQNKIELIENTFIKNDCDFNNLILDANFFIKNLSKTDRVIFLLKEVFSFDENEIGYLFDVGASRICQRYKGIQKRLHERVEKETADKDKGSEVMEELLREETEGDLWAMEFREDKGMEIIESW